LERVRITVDSAIAYAVAEKNACEQDKFIGEEG
jgi:hypothetical protein